MTNENNIETRCIDCDDCMKHMHPWYCTNVQDFCENITICPKTTNTNQNEEEPENNTENSSDTIDYAQYAELCDARDKLCNFCENDACENCQVTRLIDDAYISCPEAQTE